MPNFEVLDAGISSALNKISHNSQFKRRISLEEEKSQKEARLLRGRLIAYLIYDHFRVTGIHDSVENCVDRGLCLFTRRKFFGRMTTQHIKTLYCNNREQNMKNESNIGVDSGNYLC